MTYAATTLRAGVREMGTHRYWNWRQLHLTRSPHDQFQDDWQSRRRCSWPLPPSRRALAQWSSVAGLGLCRHAPLSAVAGLGNKPSFPFHQPCLFISFWWVCPRAQTLSITVSGASGGAAELTPGFSWIQSRPGQRAGMDARNLYSWLTGPGGGLRGTFLAAAETTCFGHPPRFSPALQRLPASSLPCWNGNMCPDEPTSSKAE